MSRWLIWSYSCPWALSEVEIHFIPLCGCVAHAAVEGGGLEVVLPGHGFILWTCLGRVGGAYPKISLMGSHTTLHFQAAASCIHSGLGEK